MKKVQDLIKKFGFIVIVFSVFIMTLTSSKVQAAEVTITRAQWLHDLTQLFGITVEQDDYPDNYFNDIDSEDEYYQDIMTAAEFGLVDIEAGEKVRPADPVTREFAVYTMNLCMGYTANAESTYDFDDQSEFIHVNDEKAAEYFNAAQVAIDQGWVELEENKFMPQKNLTLSEKNIMWKDAADYLNSQVIDENYVNKAVFADGVVEIPQTTEYQFDEFNNAKFVTLFNYMDGLKDGDTFALWQNGLPIIYKAVAVENNGSGLVVQISDAEDENSIDELDVQGTIEADLTEAVQVGEGTMTWIEGGSAEKNYMDGREISNPRLAGSKNLTAIKRSKTFTLGDGLSATVNVTIPTPVVSYKVNGIKEVYVAMDADPTVTVTVKGDARESLGLPKSLDLVYIPFGGIGTAKLSVSLEATGQCSLSYKSKVTAGVHYRRGKGTTVVNNFEKKKKPTISARAELDATLTASVGITELPGIDASAWGKVGSRMGLQAWTYEDDKKPAVCMDTWGYLHASAGITMKIASMDLGSKTVVIWDENNSPVRIANHYEDGILRNPCTRGSSNRKYYTSSDSRYFSDASGIYNSDGGTGSESTIQPRYDYTVSKNAQDEDVATITKYYGSVAAIIVPDTIDGYPVVAIGEGAFRGNKYLTAILIPDCITSIGDYAFADTNLDSLVLPAELNSLGRCILSGNKGVTEIVIPKTLSSTGSSYSNLIEGDGPFAESNVQTVVIESGMTVIPEHLFHKNSTLTSVEIPDTVTGISRYAFTQTSLTSIKIPDTVTRIGESVLAYTKLTELKLPSNIEYLGRTILGGNKGVTEIVIPKTLSSTGSSYSNLIEGDGPFAESNVQKATIEAGMTVIPEHLFHKNSTLTSVEIPDTVTGISRYAFTQTSLTSIKIPDTVTRIGESVLAYTKLTELKLPSNIEYLGRTILGGNKGVTEIVIPKTLSSTGSSYSNLIEGDGPFAESNVQKVTIEAGMTVIPEHLFHKNSTLTSVEIPDTVTEISRYAFAQTGLENIELPSSVTTLQYEIFSGGNLLQISIPDSVTGMGNAIFQNCSKLQKVKLPKARYNISDYTFAGCTSLEEIQLPKTVTTIWPHAFDGCSSLKKVEWSDCLESIKDNAFKGCTSLTEIVIPNTVRELGNEAFRNCDGLEKIVIPNSVTTIGNGVLYDCDSLTNISVGAGISKLSESCFEHCDNLEKIVLPYTIKSIDKSAFKECIALKEITIPRNTSSIGTSVFSYPAKMTIYGVAGTYAEKYAGEKGIKFVAIDKKTEKVSLDKSEVTINEGQTVQLSLNVEPKDFTDEVSWKSTDSNIATVSDTGVVTAENTGTAKIKVIVGEQSVYCNVIVTQPVTSIYLNRESVSMEALETYQLKTSIYPENANNKEVEWNSSDEKIVKVDQTGCITALAKGTATVTGKTKDGSNLWDTCTVTVTNTACIAKSVDELESPHKYENNCSDYWIYSTESDGDTLQITFDPRTEVEDGFDYIHIYSSDGTEVGKYTGTQLSGATINVSGKSVKIKLVSDNAGNEWGFKVTNITSIFEGNEKKEQIIECDDSFVKEREDDVFNLNASLAVGDGILSYVSDDTKVAEVDSDGNVTINGAGSANITIIASETENYKETRKYVKITVNESTIKNLADCTIKLEGTSFVYNGNEIMPKVTVCYGTKILQENKAYEIEYINNINPGTATVRITAIYGSGWEGFVSTTFKIKKMPDGLTVEIEPNAFANCENLFNVNIGAKVKKIGDHAFANCKNLKNIYFFGNMPEMAERSFENVSGTAYYPYNDSSWTLDKLENYGGDIIWMPWNPETNEVQKRNLLMCSIEVRQDSCIYTGRPNIPTVMIKDASYILREEKDYTITCYNNINAGAAKIVIQGAGAYSGKYETEYTIQKAQNVITAKEITKNASTKKQSANIGASAYESANLMYTSNNKSVKVSRQGKITISRKFVGSAVITIKASGTQNYNETSKKITVTVKPLGTKISKASNTLKRKVTVKWKKKTSISGYAIQYSTDKKFKAGVKTVNVNGAKKSQKVLSKLKKGKKYYIRIATYKKVGKVKYYSSWSSVKSVKVKK
ncbi:MAG: leucine-rich repeat protein [Blautia sp.]